MVMRLEAQMGRGWGINRWTKARIAPPPTPTLVSSDDLSTVIRYLDHALASLQMISQIISTVIRKLYHPPPPCR